MRKVELANPRSFLDVRNHGFRRMAVCIPRVHVGNPEANVKETIAMIESAYAQGAHYALFPELGITGYSCKDLFFQEVLQSAALDGLRKLQFASEKWPDMMFSVGLPLAVDGSLYNCAATLLRGRILAIHVKTYLPNYGEFEEKRWFKSASVLRVRGKKVVTLFGSQVAIGNDLIIEPKNDPHFRLFVEICEDLWKPLAPSTLARLAGATVFGNLSASNIIIGKAQYRRDLVLGASGKNTGAYLYAAAGFGEDVSDLGWDGHGMIAERGLMLAETKRFVTAGEMIVSDINLRVIMQDRMQEETNADNEADFPVRFRTVTCATDRGRHVQWERQKTYTALQRNVDPLPFVPRNPATRDILCREAFNILASCLRRKLEELPADRRHVIGGISGGLDSTLMALISAYTMDQMGMPRSNLVFRTLPGFGTTEGTRSDAWTLMEALHADCAEESIVPVTTELFKTMGFDPERDGWLKIVSENPQAWAREMMLLSVSCKKGGIFVGTGDLSEGMIGWCTFLGDHVSHYHINAGVPKTLVSSLIEWMRDTIFTGDENAELRACLTRICSRPVSPELLPPGADGSIVQKTDDENGPADLRDFFGYWDVRFGLAPSFIARLALHAFDGRYDIVTIKHWLEVFLRKFFGSQFKRSVAALGPKIGSVSLSPRGNWRAPTAVECNAWIDELHQNVPDSLA